MRIFFVLFGCALAASGSSAFVAPQPRVPWLVRVVEPEVLNHWGTSVALYSSSDGSVAESQERRNRPPPRGNVNRNNRGYQGGPNRGYQGGPNRGHGGSNVKPLRLENAFKLQRIVVEPPPPRRQQQRRSEEKNGQKEPVASATATPGQDGETKKSFSPGRSGGGGGGGGGPAGPVGETTGRRKRQKQKRGPADDRNDNRNNRRNSLRVGTGKKGRAAMISSRRSSLRKRDRSAEKAEKAERALERRTVSLPDGPVTVAQLADIIDEKPVAVIKFLMTDLGVMASMTQNLDQSTAVAVAEGFGKVVGADDDEDEYEDEEDEESALATGFALEDDDPEDLEPRAPVVTIMGHVDHGKTSLLDAIRNTRVTAGEAGGITQHIAAYQVDHNGKPITFIDTPGHAAFTDMRERGANITDIVILVVAADDGVKQQTADSITCARQAGVPVVVAINKCDLETADPTRVKTELTQYDLLTEDFGGDVLCSEISAKEGTNLDDLLDQVMLQAELQDLQANKDRDAEGIVVEAFLERGLGTVATTLVKRGTLKVGDVFVAGETYGKVRALFSTNDDKKQERVEQAGPSDPVRVVGFEGVPSAGDLLVVVEDEQVARELAESRQRIARERSSSSYQEGLMSSVAMAFGANKEVREMCVVVKADVQGSAEALARSLSELKLENDEAIVRVKVVVSEAGEVSKSDIALASVTPGTTVIAFGTAASYAAMEDARMLGIPIEYYSIVYDAIESVESRMQEILSPTPEGEYVGSATVQEVFNIGGTGNIAGSRCTDGYLRKGGNVRVMRGDKILIQTTIKSLRNFKAEADRIDEGNECGIGLKEFEDFQPDDVIECFLE